MGWDLRSFKSEPTLRRTDPEANLEAAQGIGGHATAAGIEGLADVTMLSVDCCSRATDHCYRRRSELSTNLETLQRHERVLDEADPEKLIPRDELTFMIHEHGCLLNRVEEYMRFLSQVMESLEQLHGALSGDRVLAHA